MIGSVNRQLLQNAARKAAQGRLVVTKRKFTPCLSNHLGDIVTPPMNYVPMWEKIATGVWFFFIFNAYPFYVAANLDEFQPEGNMRDFQQLWDDGVFEAVKGD